MWRLANTCQGLGYSHCDDDIHEHQPDYKHVGHKKEPHRTLDLGIFEFCHQTPEEFTGYSLVYGA